MKPEPLAISMIKYVGSFAENKDVAAKIRDEMILPALDEGKEIVLDYEGVETTTQSFTHALISESIRKHKDVLDKLYFKNCNLKVQSVIELVTEYMQRSIS